MFRTSTAIFVSHATIAAPSMLLSTRNNKIPYVVWLLLQVTCNKVVLRYLLNQLISQLINKSGRQSMNQSVN